MPDAYTIADARFVSVGVVNSSAGGLQASSISVPEGKIWTILAAFITCSVAETQDYWFAILERSLTFYFPVTRPVEFAVAPVTYHDFPLLTEGMEIKLYPGERLRGMRDAATAGSTITLVYRYIESDLPLYDYVEPQEQLRLQKFRRSLVPGAVSPIGGGRPSGIGGGGAIVGGRGSVPRSK